jgi:hypothetical protein
MAAAQMTPSSVSESLFVFVHRKLRSTQESRIAYTISPLRTA